MHRQFSGPPEIKPGCLEFQALVYLIAEIPDTVAKDSLPGSARPEHRVLYRNRIAPVWGICLQSMNGGSL
jgi:hypothetical protein